MIAFAKEKEDRAATAKENKVIDKIIENAQMDIPDAMVASQARQINNDFARRIQAQGMSIEQYYQYTGMDEEKMIENTKPQALKTIQTRLVLEKIAEVEAIEVTEEEVEAEIKKMADAYKLEVEKVKELLGEDQLAQMKQDLAVQKAVTLVAEQAKEVEAAE